MAIPSAWHNARVVNAADILFLIEDAQEAGDQILILCAANDTANELGRTVNVLTDAKAVTLTSELTAKQAAMVDSYITMDCDFPTVIVATDEFAATWTAPDRCTNVIRGESRAPAPMWPVYAAA